MHEGRLCDARREREISSGYKLEVKNGYVKVFWDFLLKGPKNKS
jgi:hypothetical protein